MTNPKFTHILLVVFLSFVLCPLAYSDIEPTSLDTLTAISDRIVLGQVIGVRNIAGVRVAETKVLEIFKGDSINFLLFIAQPTWACDLTHANVGETYLLFLRSCSQREFDISSAQFLGLPSLPKFLQKLRKALGQTPCVVAYSGRGQMSVIHEGDSSVVRVIRDDIVLPEQLSTSADSTDSLYRSVKWSEMIRLVKTAVSH